MGKKARQGNQLTPAQKAAKAAVDQAKADLASAQKNYATLSSVDNKKAIDAAQTNFDNTSRAYQTALNPPRTQPRVPAPQMQPNPKPNPAPQHKVGDIVTDRSGRRVKITQINPNGTAVVVPAQ
jgi:hypothetical protein